MRLALAGLGLTGVAGVMGWLTLGAGGAVAAGSGGLLATIVQIVAGWLMEGQRDAAFPRFMARWAMGTGLRIGGVLAVVALVLINPTLFAPLPTALAFLGVLIPLLALEFRTVH